VLHFQSRMIAVTVSLAMLGGCHASMVTPPGSTNPVANAPVNEASRGGVIKYSNEGAAFVRQKRREDAYKRMSEACGGKYRIDSEGPRVDGGVVLPVGDAAIAATSEAWYIQFSCVRDSTTKR
jgi:hypothetical protein